ncbi:MAG: polysaccharide biosynthesis/export family protein [Schleiferia thermophila]
MKKFSIPFLISLMALSCVSRRQLTYFQDKGASLEVDSAEFHSRLIIKYRIQPGDIIKVEVISTNEDVNRVFNAATAQQVPIGGFAGGSGGGLDPIFYLQGFFVDQLGYLTLPVVGKIHIAGLTIVEVKEAIEQELLRYFEAGTVTVRSVIPGINIKVIGDVRRPGRYVFFRNYVTVMDALAEAGDIDFVGNRTEVEIIRMTPRGFVFKTLDLTDRTVLASPDIFLEPNDIINVKPLPAKSWGIGTTGFQTFTGVLSVVSTLLTLIIVSRNLR